jgi:ABC-type antimicrobial peptide transport system permease subunit
MQCVWLTLRGLWQSSRKVQIGLLILAFFVILALLQAPINALIGHGTDPLGISVNPPWEMPNPQHWLGTDRYARDILAMTITALAASLEVGALAGLLSTLIGLVVAFVAGYKGGRIDSLLSSIIDVFLVVPIFPLLIVLAAYANKISLAEVAVLVAVFSWPFAARTIRSQVRHLGRNQAVPAAYKLPGMGIADRKERLKGDAHGFGRRKVHRLAISGLYNLPVGSLFIENPALWWIVSLIQGNLQHRILHILVTIAGQSVNYIKCF